MTPLGLAARAAGCALATWAGWRALGPIGLVVTAPLWGIAFARPLIDAFGALRHSAR